MALPPLNILKNNLNVSLILFKVSSPIFIFSVNSLNLTVASYTCFPVVGGNTSTKAPLIAPNTLPISPNILDRALRSSVRPPKSCHSLRILFLAS